MSRRALAVLALVALATVTAPAADWTQFRGPGGQGVSPEKGLPVTFGLSQNVAWKTDLPGPGTSSPVFLGDRIFLTCYTGYNEPGKGRGDMAALKRHVLGLDRKSGRMLWTTTYDAKLPELERTRDEHGYASNTPAVDAERVYVFLGKSGVAALDHAGKKLWQVDVGTRLDPNNWGSATSPVLHGNLVIVNACIESESLVALDRKTGNEVWRARGIKESWNTPLLVTKDGKTELVVAIQGKILGFDPTTGKDLWSCATDIGWYMVPSLVAHDGVVYCVGGRSGGSLAVRVGGRGDVTRTHRVWTGKVGSNVTSPVYHDGHLYWMNDNNGIAYCADAKTGKPVYEQRVERAGQVYASALLADGKVYYVTRDGRVLVVAAKPQYELLANNDLRDRSLYHASPVAVDGRLFIRSDKALYCFEKK